MVIVNRISYSSIVRGAALSLDKSLLFIIPEKFIIEIYDFSNPIQKPSTLIKVINTTSGKVSNTK